MAKAKPEETRLIATPISNASKEEAAEQLKFFENQEGESVKLARLHQVFEAGGQFKMERMLHNSKFPGIRMKWDGQTLWWLFKDKCGGIPGANVAGFICQ